MCPAAAGVGHLLRFSITIDGQTSSTFASAVSYTAPVLSSITSVTLRSSGGEAITLRGAFFGPQSTPSSLLFLTYGPGGSDFNASSCSVTVDNVEIQCLSAPGAGISTAATLWIAGRTGSLLSSALSYLAPVVTGVSPTLLKTDGSDVLRIYGTNLVRSPLGTADAVVREHQQSRFLQRMTERALACTQQLAASL